MKTINGMLFKLNRRKPEILIVAGVIGVAVSAVMACKATKKATKVIDNHKKRSEEIDENVKKDENVDGKREKIQNVVHTGVELAKIYGPAVTLGVLSVGCIFRSHRILSGRNVALAAAYNTLEQSFKKYRDRVVSVLGEEEERRFRHGTVQKEVEVVEVNEKGKEVKKKQKMEVVDVPEPDYNLSPYARIFDEMSPKWDPDPDYDKIFLMATQNYANDYLKVNGSLFLNQVYEWLGLKKSKAGHVVGWIYDPKATDRDNFVDFGIDIIYKKAAAGDPSSIQFVNGYEPVIWLDFNVDGQIINDAFDCEL